MQLALVSLLVVGRLRQGEPALAIIGEDPDPCYCKHLKNDERATVKPYGSFKRTDWPRMLQYNDGLGATVRYLAH